MTIPAPRWFWGAGVLALAALLGMWWSSGILVWLMLNALWVLVLLIEVYRVYDVRVQDLNVSRSAPPAASRGREFSATYRWSHSAARAICLEVYETLPPELGFSDSAERALCIPAHESVVEEIRFRPLARGRLSGGIVHVKMHSPWRCVWRRISLPLPWQSIVFPTLADGQARTLPTQAQRRREVGLRNVRRLGEGRVFESLREWVIGDDTRLIDWKATAKRAKPMARQYEDERRQQVLIVIDAGRSLTADVDGRSRLEYVIEATVQLAAAATEYDDNVGLMVFADEVQHFIPPARGQRAMRTIMEALATTRGKLVEPNYPAAFSFLAARNRKRALTVLFTDVVDRAASDALIASSATLRPRHVPVAVTLRHTELERLAHARPISVAAAYERSAAEELLQGRAAALAEMRSRGLVIVDVPPAGAAAAIVEQYTKLKRRGAI